MDDSLKIFLDRLKGDKKEKIEGLFSVSLLEKTEPDCTVSDQVQVELEAYLTSELLVIHLNAKGKVWLPCVVCNQITDKEIEAKGFYQTYPIKDIKDRIFDVLPILKEALLIEIPPFLECNQGDCPERKHIKSFLKKASSEKTGEHFPFSDLDNQLGDKYGST